MSTLVRIEDVEEFSPAGSIPRHAVSEQILAGVQALNEATELEPFLREILPDPTETAHTSTEITDILTFQGRSAPLADFGINVAGEVSELAKRLLETRLIHAALPVSLAACVG